MMRGWGCNAGQKERHAYLLQVTSPTEPETVVEIVFSFTASLLAADPAGDIVHAEAMRSCWLDGNVRPFVSV